MYVPGVRPESEARFGGPLFVHQDYWQDMKAAVPA
jgi:hypothetical protein